MIARGPGRTYWVAREQDRQCGAGSAAVATKESWYLVPAIRANIRSAVPEQRVCTANQTFVL